MQSEASICFQLDNPDGSAALLGEDNTEATRPPSLAKPSLHVARIIFEQSEEWFGFAPTQKLHRCPHEQM
jgi:hypothetical protein